MKANRLTLYIIIGLFLGLLVGFAVHAELGEDTVGFVDGMGLITTVFLRLIKMIIAPLVFTTLVVGVAKMGDLAAVGRVGGKALLWFVFASLVSLTLGLIMVNVLRPGDALLGHVTIDAAAQTGISGGNLTLKEFVTHLVPASVFDGMAKNEILQIVVFSLFFGAGLAALGERGKALVESIDIAAHVMLKVTGYVMWLSPLAVFAAVSAVVAKSGGTSLPGIGTFMVEFYLSILLLWLTLMALGAVFLRRRVISLIKMVREPLILAFSTASSEAAYPKTLAQLEKFGCSNRIASFVLPVGYSFNLDGSMMYCTFATVFISQAYGIELSLGTQITMLLILMLTSKGMAGVPRASLVVIAATLSQFNIPEAGLLLILGVDHFLDMARSATNVVGNSVATAVVAKWEGELTEPVADNDSSQG
ncbi:cation:dicarboxylase symporter family transporter [Permianibacter sp. IMCC34836]|uniref:dicarboxylate/amino acid:cation symporter n=1 Tax=Permianibacter fluminis TaxID=2738515 RepID=UPI0015559619|nr:cation:dicarboxylase symporter family transporter [Permianibacter fluminis]NQD36044.1 cation:dicarboxylase symporter family transporter [Permianibacter fluminis]